MMTKISKLKKQLCEWWHSCQELSAKRESEQKEDYLRKKAQKIIAIEFDTKKIKAYIMVGKLPILEIPGSESIENLLLAKQRQEDILMDYWSK